MLYQLVYFSDQISALNVFRYISFRTGGAIFTALLFVMMLGPAIIDLLRVKQGKGQPIRSDGPQTHQLKRGTPTMGGLMILAGVLVSTLLWGQLENGYVWVVMGVTLAYGMIGFYDDFLKVTKRSTDGFSSRGRMTLEVIVAAIAGYVITQLAPPELANKLTFPFFKDLMLDLSWPMGLGIGFILLSVIVIAGAGNSVNFTDGLDGLAIVPVMIAAGTFGMIAYLSGNVKFATYLQIHHVPATGELAVICGALIGAGLGFRPV